MQQQQSPQMMVNNSVPYSSLSTEQIHQILEENKRLILTIMEHNSVGKYAETTPYQIQLQKNLTFLAQIADVQTKLLEASSPQPPQQFAVQEGQHKHNSQHVQTPMSVHQSGQAVSRMPYQFDEVPQQQQSFMLQQQVVQGQAGIAANAATGPSTYQTMQSIYANQMANVQGNRQDGAEAGPRNAFGMPTYSFN